MKPRTRRLALIGGGLAALALATALILSAFEDNLVFFFTPSDIQAGEAPTERTFRIGGLVEDGSVERVQESTEVLFRVTDMEHSVVVSYTGILPDLFREGQGVVAEGRLNENGTFVASRVLARHDETYMPVEAAEALQRAHDEGVRRAAEESAATGDKPAAASYGY